MTIPRAPSCDDVAEPMLLPVADARARLHAMVSPLEHSESVALREACGRVLANDLRSAIDVPAHVNSAMDGYAIHHDCIPASGEVRLRVAGTAWAGRPHAATVAVGQAVRIFTGAKMPDGTDTVVIQEHVAVDGTDILIDAEVQAGRNVRQAGEDVRCGETVLPAGTRLGAAEMGVIASLGVSVVEVVRRVRVAFFTTGDELCSLDTHAGQVLPDGAVFDSNRYLLCGLLEALGVTMIDLGVVPDDAQATRVALGRAAAQADVVVSSGGVSAGAADHVTAALEATGQVAFWKIAMRPGRPLAVGHLGDACFFGLPGNPVAVMVTFLQFVQPALRRLMGMPEQLPLEVPARCESTLRKSRGRLEYQRGVVSTGADGTLTVVSTGKQGAGRLSSMTRANCLIVLPPEMGTVQAGTTVQVQPFHGLLP